MAVLDILLILKIMLLHAGTTPLSYITVIDHHILLSLIFCIFEGEQYGLFRCQASSGSNTVRRDRHKSKAQPISQHPSVLIYVSVTLHVVMHTAVP